VRVKRRCIDSLILYGLCELFNLRSEAEHGIEIIGKDLRDGSW
jgi:hypothetical protein